MAQTNGPIVTAAPTLHKGNAPAVGALENLVGLMGETKSEEGGGKREKRRRNAEERADGRGS